MYVDEPEEERVRKAEEVWAALDDVCVDDYDNIDMPCDLPWLGHYEVGTFREDIWHDIEDELHVSVAWLMGEAKNPDGTN